MLTTNEIRSIVADCSYKDNWNIECSYDGKRGMYYIQVEVSNATCSVTRKQCEPWKSGKKYLSEHMCKQEIVGAVFAVIKAAEEHEMHEWFRYRVASIFNPHLDPDKLAELASKKGSFVCRPDNSSMRPE